MKVIESVDDILLLRNNENDCLVSISDIEYKILHDWSQSQGTEKIIKKYGREFEIDENIIIELVFKAIKLNVLCRKDYIFIKSYKIGGPLQYLFVKIVFVINAIFRINIVPVFDGNLQFFKLFYYDFSYSVLDKALTNKHVQFFLKWMIPIVMVVEVLIIFFGKSELIIPTFTATTLLPFLQILMVMVLFFLCLTIHELAHYFVYKLYGGTSNEIGAGLMYVIFPVVYVNTINVYYWKKKRNKILLSSAGMIVDIIIFMSVIILLKYCHAQNIFTVSVSCVLFYYLFFLIININIFIPGTDGYYIFSDLIEQKRLYGNSYDEVRLLIVEIFTHRIKKKNFSHIMNYIYYMLCVINITLCWGAFVSLLTFPLWINFIC